MAGFLIRGTLRPSMGTMTGVAKGPAIPVRFPVHKPPNRVPPSITLKRNPGAR